MPFETVLGNIEWKFFVLSQPWRPTFKVSFEVVFIGKFIKKETLAQVFSCQFCEISKKTFFAEHLRKTAS